MKVLVINCGSSSLKYQLIDMETEKAMAVGLCERIGIEGARIKHEVEGKDKVVIEEPMKDHNDAIRLVLETLVHEAHGAIKSMDEIDAVGHRVVHGGEKFASSVIIDEKVMDALNECIELAPLHNPANILGIKACEELLKDVPMVGVFDTAFHQTMPASNYMYAVPYEDYKNHGVRKYGFHGTSHRYVADRVAHMMDKDLKDIKIVTCHLGNGASIAAVENGKSIDTSMGFTPLEGLMMGTRSGDLDPAIVTFIMEKENLSLSQVNNILNKESGVYGVSGVSSDFRDVEDAAKSGNERAVIALKGYANRVKKYIGAYMAEMNGADAIVFTAGLGENGIETREDICKGLEGLGIEMDFEKNKVRGKETLVSKDGSKVKIFVIPTNEELMIARDTVALVK